MGAVLCSSSATTLTAASVTHVPVPTALMESVFQDVEICPSFVPLVLKLERLTGDGFAEGMKWREVRVFRGREITVYKTITRIVRNNDNNNKKNDCSGTNMETQNPSTPAPSLSLTVSVDLQEMSWDKKHAAEIFTISIQPAIAGDDSDKAMEGAEACTLCWTMAFVSAGCMGKIVALLFKNGYMQAVQKHVDEKMSYYAAEAVRRWENINKNKEMAATSTTTTDHQTSLPSDPANSK